MTATLCLPDRIYHSIMRWARTKIDPQTEILALQASALEDNASRAGFALACTYANSSEYEAELIATRRRAGVYGPKRGPWIGRIAAIVTSLLIFVALILLKS